MKGVFVTFICLASLMMTLKGQNKKISLVAVGDMMYGTDFPSDVYLPSHDNPNKLIEEVIPLFRSADVVFGNLEGCFLDGGSVFKRCKDTTKCYAFRTPEKYASVLQYAGFDILNLANNHIRDFGPSGLNSTIRILEDMKIPYMGLIDKPSDTIWVNGLKIGICGFSPNTGTARINDHNEVIRIVKGLEKKCDIVIVSFHGGAEGAKNQNVNRETEIFYGENRGNVYEFAHNVIDAGADLVIGHGPHVPRAMEVYKGRAIFYSLGNFCTYSRFNLSGPNRLTPVMEVNLNEEGRLISGKIHAYKQEKGVGVLKDDMKSVVYKMKDLTKMDFPELNDRLVIDDEGRFFMLFDEVLPALGIDALLK